MQHRDHTSQSTPPPPPPSLSGPLHDNAPPFPPPPPPPPPQPPQAFNLPPSHQRLSHYDDNMTGHHRFHGTLEEGDELSAATSSANESALDSAFSLHHHHRRRLHSDDYDVFSTQLEVAEETDSMYHHHHHHHHQHQFHQSAESHSYQHPRSSYDSTRRSSFNLSLLSQQMSHTSSPLTDEAFPKSSSFSAAFPSSSPDHRSFYESLNGTDPFSSADAARSFLTDQSSPKPHSYTTAPSASFPNLFHARTMSSSGTSTPSPRDTSLSHPELFFATSSSPASSSSPSRHIHHINTTTNPVDGDDRFDSSLSSDYHHLHHQQPSQSPSQQSPPQPSHSQLHSSHGSVAESHLLHSQALPPSELSLPPHQSYHGHRVLPLMFVGGEAAAQDLQWLRSIDCDHVLNLTSEVPNFWEEYSAGEASHFSYFRVPMDDSSDVRHFLPAAYRFIQESIGASKAILVHSKIGDGRAPVMVMAYLIRYFHWELRAACERIQELLPEVRVKDSYARQLMALDLEMHRHHTFDFFAADASQPQPSTPNNSSTTTRPQSTRSESPSQGQKRKRGPFKKQAEGPSSPVSSRTRSALHQQKKNKSNDHSAIDEDQVNIKQQQRHSVVEEVQEEQEEKEEEEEEEEGVEDQRSELKASHSINNAPPGKGEVKHFMSIKVEKEEGKPSAQANTVVGLQAVDRVAKSLGDVTNLPTRTSTMRNIASLLKRSAEDEAAPLISVTSINPPENSYRYSGTPQAPTVFVLSGSGPTAVRRNPIPFSQATSPFSTPTITRIQPNQTRIGIRVVNSVSRCPPLRPQQEVVGGSSAAPLSSTSTTSTSSTSSSISSTISPVAASTSAASSSSLSSSAPSLSSSTPSSSAPSQSRDQRSIPSSPVTRPSTPSFPSSDYSTPVSTPTSSLDVSGVGGSGSSNKRRGSYKCGKCGQPKKGHNCSSDKIKPSGKQKSASTSSLPQVSWDANSFKSRTRGGKRTSRISVQDSPTPNRDHTTTPKLHSHLSVSVASSLQNTPSRGLILAPASALSSNDTGSPAISSPSSSSTTSSPSTTIPSSSAGSSAVSSYTSMSATATSRSSLLPPLFSQVQVPTEVRKWAEDACQRLQGFETQICSLLIQNRSLQEQLRNQRKQQEDSSKLHQSSSITTQRTGSPTSNSQSQGLYSSTNSSSSGSGSSSTVYLTMPSPRKTPSSPATLFTRTNAGHNNEEGQSFLAPHPTSTDHSHPHSNASHFASTSSSAVTAAVNVVSSTAPDYTPVSASSSSSSATPPIAAAGHGYNLRQQTHSDPFMQHYVISQQLPQRHPQSHFSARQQKQRLHEESEPENDSESASPSSSSLSSSAPDQFSEREDEGKTGSGGRERPTNSNQQTTPANNRAVPRRNSSGGGTAAKQLFISIKEMCGSESNECMDQLSSSSEALSSSSASSTFVQPDSNAGRHPPHFHHKPLPLHHHHHQQQPHSSPHREAFSPDDFFNQDFHEEDM
ncbi:Dual specificity protein phosphatase 6 [Balamuthia mandrillaris]